MDTGLAVATTFSMITITLERYLAIIHGINLSVKSTSAIIAGIWIMSFLFGAYPYLCGGYADMIVLGESRIDCQFKWFTYQPLLLPISITAITMLIILPTALGYAYYKILYSYFSRRRTNNELSPKERLLIIKATAICSTQLLLWTPYFVRIIYEISTHQTILILDAISTVCAILNSLTNCVILYWLDFNIQSNLKEWFFDRMSTLTRRRRRRRHAPDSSVTESMKPSADESAERK